MDLHQYINAYRNSTAFQTISLTVSSNQNHFLEFLVFAFLLNIFAFAPGKTSSKQLFYTPSKLMLFSKHNERCKQATSNIPGLLPYCKLQHKISCVSQNTSALICRTPWRISALYAWLSAVLLSYMFVRWQAQRTLHTVKNFWTRSLKLHQYFLAATSFFSQLLKKRMTYHPSYKRYSRFSLQYLMSFFSSQSGRIQKNCFSPVNQKEKKLFHRPFWSFIIIFFKSRGNDRAVKKHMHIFFETSVEGRNPNVKISSETFVELYSSSRSH